MTTIAEYRQLTPSQVDKLVRNPEDIEAFLEGFDADDDFQAGFDDDDDDDDDFDDEGGGGGDDDEEEAEDEDEDEDFRLSSDDEATGSKYLSLEKSWQSLQFLLTASTGSGELHEVFMGGTDVADEEIMTFDARVIAPDEVPPLAAALAKIKTADLKAKYNPKAFRDAKVEAFVDDFPGLVNSLRELTAFFEDASENGNAILITIR